MIIVGHRGARNEAPENTLEGFVHAYRNGCRHFELDIQLSQDQELMVFHDKTLARSCDHPGKLGDFYCDYLTRLDARYNTPGWPGPCSIPTLNSLLEALPQVAHWQFEVKSDTRAKMRIIAYKLDKLIHERNLSQVVTITSADRYLLAHLNANYPQLSTGYVAESYFINPVSTAQKLGCDYLCMSDRLVGHQRVENAKALGMHVSIWTVNDVARMRTLKSLGVDSVITDIPSHALATTI